MYTQICEDLGIEVPIFAFSHCRDVVAAVSKAGGLGVLGAGFMDAAQLKEELDWIDEHVGDKPYGVDVVIPQNYVGRGEDDLSESELEEKLWAMVPEGHQAFAEKLLTDHGVPHWHEPGRPKILGWTLQTVMPCIEEALTRPKCRLIANALGTPPDDVIRMVKDSGRLIGALCGKRKQAIQHKEAGLDFVVAQGTEGGGHTGEIGSTVLWPDIIDAVHPLPVLAAGGNRDFSLIHHDSTVARATGAPDAFANTYFLMGMFERVVREWAGPGARIRKIGPLRMMVFNAVGDTVTFKGVVEAVDSGSRLVVLDLWAESDRGKTVTCKVHVETTQ